MVVVPINPSSLIFPVPPAGNPFHQIYQSNQDRHFNQRPHRRRQSLIAVGTEGRHGDGNGQLEVVAGRREALSGRQLVAEPQALRDDECEKENDDEIHNQGSSDPDDRDNLMDDPFSLRCKQDQNGVEKAQERPGGDAFEKFLLVPGSVDRSEDEARGDGSSERYAEEDADAPSDNRVGNLRRATVADDVDEEDGQGCIQDHLQDGVDRYKNGTVLLITASEARPDQDLQERENTSQKPWQWGLDSRREARMGKAQAYHSNTAREADEYKSDSKIRFIWQEGPSQTQLIAHSVSKGSKNISAGTAEKTYHEKRCNDPIGHDAETELYPDLAMSEKMV